MRHVRTISKQTVPALGQDDSINIFGPLRVVSYLRLLGLTGAKKDVGFPAEGDPEDL